MDLKSKIILISGPTASGKSKFAIQLAKKINGEVINADSMQIFKELKILTARPQQDDLKNIKHHLYGFKSVKDNYSTGNWLKDAKKKINNIIVEAQKKKINTIGDLDNIVKLALKSNDKSLLIAIYNNNNQRRYIGVKLN